MFEENKRKTQETSIAQSSNVKFKFFQKILLKMFNSTFDEI